jgi:hypothetical protein
MHDIEPYYRWRDYYTAETDEKSPFYGRVYNEMQYTDTIYNYYIHPQWDYFGSPTLYMKLLYVDYEDKFAIIELMGEWNDCINNDIMFFKRDILDHLINEGIYKFIVICENVLNFHSSDDCYYEELWDDIKEEDGWLCLLNTYDHVTKEMSKIRLQYYINFGFQFNDIDWHNKEPEYLFEEVSNRLKLGQRYLP